MSPISDEGGYPGEYSLETIILQENTKLREENKRLRARIAELETDDAIYDEPAHEDDYERYARHR